MGGNFILDILNAHQNLSERELHSEPLPLPHAGFRFDFDNRFFLFLSSGISIRGSRLGVDEPVREKEGAPGEQCGVILLYFLFETTLNGDVT